MARLFGRGGTSEGPRTVTVTQTGKQFPAPGKDSVLNEALAAGVPFPHSCTVGTCGTCKSKLISGKVREITDSALALTSEELKAGYILACQSIARQSLVLDVEGLDGVPDHDLMHLDGEVTACRALTHDILEVQIALDGPLQYSAGQYAELRFHDIAGPRSYSFAQAPSPAEADSVSFYVRLVPGGELTEWLFSENRTGAKVDVAGPFGNLWLRPSTNPILCVAGGSGLAPIKALLEEANEQDCNRETVVVFGAREERDLYCLDELAALAKAWSGPFSFVPVLSQEAAASAWPGARGLVTEVVEGLSSDFLLACDVYTCGPPVMIDALEAELAGLGRAPAQFHADRFVTRTAGGLSAR